MRRLLGVVCVLSLTGCLMAGTAIYEGAKGAGARTAGTTIYETARDERSFATQAGDEKIKLQIMKNLLTSDVKGTGGLDVFCSQGSVVLVGVVEEGSQAGDEAVRIARAVEGVRWVDTYFVPSRPSRASDFVIKEKTKARLIADYELVASQVDMAVYAGNVVLVGVVDRQEKIDGIIAHARAVDGVVEVRSFIQIKAQ